MSDPAATRDSSSHHLNTLLVTISNQDGSALACKKPRRCCSDPRGSTGDDSYFPFKPFAHSTCSSIRGSCDVGQSIPSAERRDWIDSDHGAR